MSDEVARPAGEVGAEVGMGTPDADLAKVFEDEALRVVTAGAQTLRPGQKISWTEAPYWTESSW